MKLINGKGQLGEALKGMKGDWTIYHTWDFINKNDAEIQRKCFMDFINYVNKHQKEKICFISTLSQADTPYTRYKMLAEKYLINVIKDYKIIRICGIIGKGVCDYFRERKIKPHGEMDVTTLRWVVTTIRLFLLSKSKEYDIRGTKVPANIVEELILFGKNGKATL